MIPHTRVSEEVAYGTGPVTVVDGAVVAWLKDRARETARKRFRLCAHPDTADSLHEMVIVHAKGAYVPPHKHPGKSESFHVVEGALTVVVFDEDGTVNRTIPMAANQPGRAFFYRLSGPLYHTVIPESDWVVFHEVTNGPFRREDMLFAPWAPGETAEPEAQAAFVARLTGGAA